MVRFHNISTNLLLYYGNMLEGRKKKAELRGTIVNEKSTNGYGFQKLLDEKFVPYPKSH